jgi:hypothetical protein
MPASHLDELHQAWSHAAAAELSLLQDLARARADRDAAVKRVDRLTGLVLAAESETKQAQRRFQAAEDAA